MLVDLTCRIASIDVNWCACECCMHTCAFSDLKSWDNDWLIYRQALHALCENSLKLFPPRCLFIVCCVIFLFYYSICISNWGDNWLDFYFFLLELLQRYYCTCAYQSINRSAEFNLNGLLLHWQSNTCCEFSVTFVSCASEFLAYC